MSKDNIEIMYFIASIVGVVVSICSLLYSVIKNRRIVKKQNEFEIKMIEKQAEANRIQCNMEFDNLIDEKVKLIDCIMSDLPKEIQEIDETCNKEIKESLKKSNGIAIMRTFNFTINFYNKVESFCGKIVDKSYYCEEYLKSEIKKPLHEIITIQPEFYLQIYKLFRKYALNQYFYLDIDKCDNNIKKFLKDYYGEEELEKYAEKLNNIYKG